MSAPLSAQESAIVLGRILDEQTLAPIRDVLVRIGDGPLSALTAPDGSFRIANVPPGTLVVTFQHLSYGQHGRPLFVQAGDSVSLQLRFTRVILDLPEVTVVGLTELEQRRVSTGNSMNEVHRPEIERAATMGHSLGRLLENSLNGVSVRAGSAGQETCVEYRGAVSAVGEPCRDVAVFLDGVPVTVPAAFFATMPLTDIERLEVLSPGQAGALYGGEAGRGVLLVETRRGIRRGPSRPGVDLISGFDWSEELRPYDWMRVVGGSLVGNALGLGLSTIVADRCFSIFRIGERDPNREVMGIHSRCNSLTTAAAGFLMLELPGLGGSLGARWGGATERSQGRVFPGLVLGTLSAAAGYVLVVRGSGRNSSASVTAGMLVLTVGTPALLVFADRGFRVLRR